MAKAKRPVSARSRLSKADAGPDDQDEKDKRDDQDAPPAPEPTQKADDTDDDDPSDVDSEVDDSDGDDDEDGGDDELPVGEFRILVLPNGNIRIHPDDLQDEPDDDDDDADKSDAGDDDDDGNPLNDPEDDDMGKSDASKRHPATATVVSEEALRKGIQTLVDLGKGGPSGRDGVARLLRRAQSAQGISKSEARRLFGRVAGHRDDASARLSDAVRKSYDQDEDLAQAQTQAAQDSDVAGYLESLTERTCKSTAALADGLQSQVAQLEERLQGFHGVLAKAMSQSLAAQKLMSERMGIIEAQPVRARKSLSQPPVEAARKSFAGEAPQARLSKSELLDTLTRMNVESMREGRRGLSKGNRPLMNGVEAAMQDQQVDPALLDEVVKYRAAHAD